MSKFIGRKLSIGVAKEGTRGTLASSLVWLPKMDFATEDKVNTVIDDSSLAVIEDSNSSDVVLKYGEHTISGRITDIGIGHILMAAFGTDTKTTTSGESAVYDHSYTVLQNAQHPSYTLGVSDPNGVNLQYALSMLTTLAISAEVGQYMTYKADWRSNSNASSGTNTVSFSAENVFLPQHATVLISPTAAGNAVAGQAATGTATSTTHITGLNISTTLLQVGMAVTGTNIPVGATITAIISATAVDISIATTGAATAYTFTAVAINIRKCDITITKNVEDDPTLGNLNAIDRYNKKFQVEGTLELVYDARTYVDTIMLGDVVKALRLSFINTGAPIGSASFPTIALDLARCKIQEVAKTNKNDDITLQTIKFKAFYSLADTYLAKCLLRNTQSAAY